MLNFILQMYYIIVVSGTLLFLAFYAWILCPFMLIYLALIAYWLLHKLPFFYWGKYTGQFRK